MNNMEEKIEASFIGPIREITEDIIVCEMKGDRSETLIIEFEKNKLDKIDPVQIFEGNIIYFYIYKNSTSKIFADPPIYINRDEIIKAEILAQKLYEKMEWI